MNSKTTVSKATITKFLFLLISILMLSGIKGFANYVSFFSFIVLCLLNFKTPITRELICVFSFLTFYVVTSIPLSDVDYCLKYTVYNLLIFSPLFYYSLDSKGITDSNRIKRDLFLFLFVWLVISIVSISLYISDPGAARNLARDGDAYSGNIIGGYSLAYGSALLCTYIFGSILNKEIDKSTRLLSAFTCIILTILVYLTESTLTTFAMFAGIASTIIFKGKVHGINKFIRFLFGFILISLILLVAYIEISSNVYSIISWLNSHSDSLIFRRLREIVNSIFLGINSRHVNERSGLIMQSIELFFDSPIIGHGYKYGNIFTEGKIFGIGNHSELFDSLARYGLLGSFPLLNIYIRGIKRVAAGHLGLVVCFVMLVLFNPFISFGSNLALFVIIPLINQFVLLNRKNTT